MRHGFKVFVNNKEVFEYEQPKKFKEDSIKIDFYTVNKKE